MQLDLGCTSGCKVAVHAKRRFMFNMPANFVIAKLDFSNAFNSLREDLMLSVLAENTHDIYKFCHISYYCNKPTHLKLSGLTILSWKGAKQDNRLGPLLFCFSIHSLLLCKSKLTNC